MKVNIKKISKLCTPAILYLILSVVSLVSMITTFSLQFLVVKILFIFVWTCFLNFLCKKGHSGISWFLVLFPFILMLLILFFSIDVMTIGKNNNYKEGFIDDPTSSFDLNQNGFTTAFNNFAKSFSNLGSIAKSATSATSAQPPTCIYKKIPIKINEYVVDSGNKVTCTQYANGSLNVITTLLKTSYLQNISGTKVPEINAKPAKSGTGAVSSK